MCNQACGQKNLSAKKASVYLDLSKIIFTKNWNLKNSKKFLKKFKPSIFLIQAYQIFLSPYLGGRCRYYPSCSNYAIECFEKHNFLSAIKFVAVRLSSCQPFSKNKNYYDPVPFNLKGVS